MGISFLYPALLAGLVALGIPILIHLIHRRRVRLVRFPAVRFILLSRRRIARRHRLKNFLLLMLRLGAVASFVGLVAHPFLTARGTMAGSRWAPLTVALLVDNSLSMGYQLEGGTRFELARRAAEGLLKGLGEEDRALVLGTASSPEGWPREAEPPARALGRLASLSLTAGGGDLVGAFSRAYEALAGPAYQKELIVLTDLARSDWARFDLRSIRRLDPHLPLRVVRVGAPEEAPNASVRAVRWLGEALTAGVEAAVEAEVVNHSDRPLRSLRVRLHAEGRVRAEARVDLAPREARKVTFTFTPERAGPAGGWVELARDRLPEDDRRFLAGQVGEKVRVLLVDGDPRTSLALSETFYVLHALRAAGTPSPFALTLIPGHGLGGVKWEEFDVALFCNVSDWPPPARQGINRFLGAGKGVFLALGELVDPEGYNRELFEGPLRLLPAPMGPAVRRPTARPARVRDVRLDHPVLQAFKAQDGGAFGRALVEGYIPVVVGGRAGVRTLLALDDSTPLLVEHEAGPAKVLLYASSCDRDWTNLPIVPAFVPLIQRSVFYLAGRLREAPNEETPVGAPRAFLAEGRFAGRLVTLRGPDRAEQRLRLERRGERAAAEVAGQDRPGLYRVQLPSGGFLYAVNPPPEESDLRPLRPEELRQKLEGVPLSLLSYRGEAGGLGDIARARTDLAPWLILALLATLAAESWLANQL